MLIDLPPENSAAVEFEEAVNKHLRRSIKSLLELPSSTQAFNHLTEPLKHVGLGKDFTIEVILPVPELQKVSDRILKCADTYLKRAAVPYEGADIERDSVLGGAYTLVRRAEEGKSVFRLVNDRIEVSGRDRRVPVHEREIGVHLSQECDLRSPSLRLAQARHQVQREVGVATQAVTGRAALLCFTNKLGQHVDASVQQIAHDVSVVAAHITLLRKRTVE